MSKTCEEKTDWARYLCRIVDVVFPQRYSATSDSPKGLAEGFLYALHPGEWSFHGQLVTRVQCAPGNHRKTGTIDLQDGSLFMSDHVATIKLKWYQTVKIKTEILILGIWHLQDENRFLTIRFSYDICIICKLYLFIKQENFKSTLLGHFSYLFEGWISGFLLVYFHWLTT